MKITSLTNQQVKMWTSLRTRKGRKNNDLFLLEGYHLVEEAQKKGYCEYTIGLEGTDYIVTKEIIEKVSDSKSSQDIIGVCKISKVLENKPLSDKVLILENVQDPGNLGTLLRSAKAFDFNTIVLDGCCDIFNPKVVRSSQGAMFKLGFVYQNSIDFLNDNNGYYSVGTSMNGASIFDLPTKDKVCLILGNEGSGVSDELLQRTETCVTISMSDTESLNVSVAGSIIMHSIYSK